MEPEGVGDAAMFINIQHHYIITLTRAFQSASVGPGGENHDEWSPLTPMSSPGFDPRCLAPGNEPGGVTHAYSQGPSRPTLTAPR